MVVYGVTGVSIVNSFSVRELNFKKSPSARLGPAVLTVKIVREIRAFSFPQMYAVLRGSCVISTLVLRVSFCGSACPPYI